MIRRIALIALLVLAIGLAVLWFARRSIADDVIAQQLTKSGVPARFKVTEIGFGWQRIEQISLGDPMAPDLTADWAEVRLTADWNGVHADAIRAAGVRLRGTLVDGRISWGALDRLIPKSGGGPFVLPDLDVTLDDARIALATPWGPVGAKLEGHGGLRNGFAGKLAAVMPAATIGTCTARQATAYVDLTMRQGEPRLQGPVRVQSASCAGTSVGPASVGVDASLSKSFDAWRGQAALDVSGLTNGQVKAGQVTGSVTFEGTEAATTGRAQLASANVLAGASRLSGVSLDGSYALRGNAFDSTGAVKVARAVPDARLVAGLPGLLAKAAPTPVGPLAAQLGSAVAAAARGAAIDVTYALTSGEGGTSAKLATINARTNSGAVLQIAGGQGVRIGAAGLFADTHATLSGGGFPKIDADIRRKINGESQGLVRVAPLSAGDARLGLGPLRFLARGNGYVRIATVATLDGSFDSGRVEGLTAPLVIARLPDGRVIANPGCGPVKFARFRLETLTLAPATLNVCATGPSLTDGATVASPALRGTIGTTPLDARAASAKLSFGDGRFGLGTVKVRLGSGDRVTAIDATTLDGTMRGGALAGNFTGVVGTIAKVPLLVDAGAGNWAFAKGVLDLKGTATVSDADPHPRFNPLTADGLTLRLAHGLITANSVLRQPSSGIEVAKIDLTHELGKGIGHATLDVADLRFGKSLQPEALTRLTLGVIANVQGAVSGRSDIRWSPDGVKSTGRFSTSDLDFAAAFGPVDGASGTIEFTDLLGLVTAPGQVATIGSVNPGIPVLAGQIIYHLEAGQKIAVEGGRWPFAGGALVLEPTLLDMSEAQERRLTFRVDGLDAAQFIQTLQFENLNATGLFDGKIPMIFDAQGGRIEGGEIAARNGGTLSYVGDVTNAPLNGYARMAFDALKSIRYRNLVIGLNGPLDGEMVSTINFRGVNQNPDSKPKGFIARQLAGLPFKFNIVVRAPFRQLLSTARTFQDPTLILKRLNELPPAIMPDPIQPAESEKRP